MHLVLATTVAMAAVLSDAAAYATAAAAAAAPRAQSTCDISAPTYGAKPDGISDSTSTIQRALNDCAGSPGVPGIVRVPRGPGSYRAGSLRLRSHQRLVVEPGAVVQGLTDKSKYPEGAPFPSFCGTDSGTRPDCRGSCQLPLVGGDGITDVAIVGGGTVDGGSPSPGR
jgi:polygalacturonase